ncbi:MAG: arylsulfatase [Lachnospiraceae bacterium]|nr:arylsulfatase [Lachnospiraceae bacterium]
MSKQKFVGTIGKTLKDTDFRFEEIESKSEGKPNVIYIVLDDVGFAQLGCYGSDIKTPNIDRLASGGLRYNNFHTTAICSATRASLLTGANHHSAGISAIVESATGLPNGQELIKPEYATIAEVLREYDYHTIAIGKWHLTDKRFRTAAGPFDGWPLGKGFDNYYGFLDAAIDQWNPVLTRDNSRVTQPKKASEGYHLTEDLTDNAIRYVYQHHNAYPKQPFFLYLAYGAMHAPMHAPKEYIDRYRGAFDQGWDVLREKWFARQKKLGVIPQDAELTERNEVVPAWDSLSEDEKKVQARLMEVFAGFLEHTDAQIGRLLDYLEEAHILENTMIVLLSDNGASAEGGLNGHYNHYTSVDIVEDYSREAADVLKHYETVGDEYSSPHYGIGWANLGNVPFQWYKTWVHEGGIKDPLIIYYPGRIKDKGGIRNQFHHVTDISPTVLDVLGFEKPAIVKGVPQQPMHGISLAYTFEGPDIPSRKHVQYFEMVGNRSIYKNGWKAVTNHAFKSSYEDDVWELYHTEKDYSEKYNVAAEYPEKVKELEETWIAEAGRYGVYPLGPGSLIASKEATAEITIQELVPEKVYTYENVRYPFEIPEGLLIARTSHRILADIERQSPKEEGVILANGDRFGGSVLYVKDNHLKYVYNHLQSEYYEIVSDVELPVGRNRVEVVFKNLSFWEAEVFLKLNGAVVGTAKITELNKFASLMCTTLKANPQTAIAIDYEIPFEFTGKILHLEIRMAPAGMTTEEMLEAFFRQD